MKRVLFVVVLFFLILGSISTEAQYTWRPKACLPAAPRHGFAAFTLGNFGYLVCATTLANPALNEVWRYDVTTNTWTQLNNFPVSRSCPAVFIINDTVYVGLGLDNGGVYNTDFYKYNAALDQWTQVASFPGIGRYLAMTFVLNGKGYVGCGKGGSQYNDFYQYDPVLNVWTTKASLPGNPREGGAGFTLGNNGFVCLGYDGSFYNDAYKYDDVANAWTTLNNFPGSSRSSFGFFMLNDTFYIAGGVGAGGRVDECWRYNGASDSWTQQQSFTCIAPPRSTLYGFTLNGHGYITCGDHGNGTFANDLLEFGPDDVSFTNRVHVLGNDTSYCNNFNRVLSTGNVCTLWSTGVTAAQITVSTAGTYWAHFADTCGMVSDTINITQGAPAASLGNDTTYCGNFSRVLSVGNAAAVWSTGVTGTQITITGPGTYWVSINTPCGSATDTIVISQKPGPTLSLGNDTNLCSGQTLLLDATNVNSSYHWQDNSFNPTFTVSTAGIYSVTVTSTSGCSLSDTVQVTYASDIPLVDLGRNKEACGDSLLLKPSIANAHYHWSDNSTDSTLTVTSSGVYSVTVTDGCGSATGEVNINLHQDECRLLIPTGFSPNGDGKNDLFRAVSRCQSDKFAMKVYNRWGEMVYSSNDIFDGWDGTLNNKQQPMSVYVYYIEYFNFCEQKLKRISGNVTLVR